MHCFIFAAAFVMLLGLPKSSLAAENEGARNYLIRDEESIADNVDVKSRSPKYLKSVSDLLLPSRILGMKCQDNYSCGHKCDEDIDCETAGRYGVTICCSKCGKYQGTEYYQYCYNPDETPAPTPAPTSSCQDTNSCGHTCDEDVDCETAGRYGVNICCSKCGKYRGTEYYKQCYNPDETSAPTPAPTPSCQDTYSCGHECDEDIDCETAGRYGADVCCKKCNKSKGTMGYQRCFDPRTPSPTLSPSIFYDDDY